LIAVGLDADEALERLEDEKAVKRVKEQEEYWKYRGVASIPTMVLKPPATHSKNRIVESRY